MSSVALDIAEYLEDQSIGVVGTDIFVGFQPDISDNIITIYVSGGSSPSIPIDLEYPSIQVVVRNTSYATCESKAYSIFNALHTTGNTSIEGSTYQGIYANQQPFSLGKDDQNRSEFVINFRISKTR